MRRRTSEEIKACTHIEPLVEVAGSCEYGRRGEMYYAIKGCTRCGGIAKEMRLHLNRGPGARTAAEMNQLNTEDAERVATEIAAWREALPEPEVVHG